jgi:hypothetical protein
MAKTPKEVVAIFSFLEPDLSQMARLRGFGCDGDG